MGKNPENVTRAGIQNGAFSQLHSRPQELVTTLPALPTIPPEQAESYTYWYTLCSDYEFQAQTGQEIAPVVEFLLQHNWRFHPNIPYVLYRPGVSELESRNALEQLRNIFGMPAVGGYELAVYCQFSGMPLRECSPGATRIIYRVQSSERGLAVVEKLYVSESVADLLMKTSNSEEQWTTRLDNW